MSQQPNIRRVTLTRKTSETNVTVELCLDGGDYEIDTGVGFFNHMLDHVARHGQLGLKIQAKGDHHIDDHHTIEDVGILLGQALDQALGDKKGIERYGFASVPMDEALARVSIDLSGRSSLTYGVQFVEEGGKIGHFDTQLVREFLVALTSNGRFNCHIEAPCGDNNHHIAEAIFKALGRSLRQAVLITGNQIPSTKGLL